MEKKEIIFAIKVMSGGGAERVISLLSSSMVDKGYSVILLLTHQSEKDAILCSYFSAHFVHMYTEVSV